MDVTENKQLVLPLDLMEKPDYQERIKQNWKFTFSRQVLTSVYTKRALGYIIAQIKKENEVKEYYQVQAYNIIQETGLDKDVIYRNMKTVINELIHVAYFFEDEENQTFIPRHLVDTTRFKNPVGYHNGILTVAFNPALRDIILQVAHYTEYELSIYIKCSSWYSMRLYELLSSFKDTGWWEVSVNEYRELMGCSYEVDKKGRIIMDKKTGQPKVKYPNVADLIKYTTKEPLKELENTDCAFNVLSIYDTSKGGRGRRPIVALRFELKHKRTPAKEKIERWCLDSERKGGKFKKMYERLKKYNVTDEIIVKHIPTIGEKKMNEVLHEWDLRQLPSSKNPILNTEHYCNKVIAELGKKILEEKEAKK